MIKSTTEDGVSRFRKRKWVFLGVLVFIVANIGFIIWFFHVGSTNEIESVANQFKPDTSWKLTTSDIQPPRTLCIDVECPRVLKQWESKTAITADDLSLLLKKSGWDFRIDGDCVLDNPNRYGDSVEVCSASGFINGYDVSVSVSSSNPPVNYQVGLNIELRSDS